MPLIEENKKYLFNIAISILGNEEDAGDAIGETIIKAYESIKNLREPKFFKTWITRILINESKKILISRGKVISIEEYKQEQMSSYQDKENIDLKNALKKLSKEHYDVIMLFYYNDLKINEKETPVVFILWGNYAKAKKEEEKAAEQIQENERREELEKQEESEEYKKIFAFKLDTYGESYYMSLYDYGDIKTNDAELGKKLAIISFCMPFLYAILDATGSFLDAYFLEIETSPLLNVTEAKNASLVSSLLIPL